MGCDAAKSAGLIDETNTVFPPRTADSGNVVSRNVWFRFLTGVGIVTGGLLLAATSSWAEPTHPGYRHRDADRRQQG
jgi:hypothetical protein